MKLSLIAAIGKNRELGRKGDLIWRIKEDLQNFKSLTMGHHILMGRKTWDSIGRALPGRTMIVVSRSRLALPEGVFSVKTLEEAYELAQLRSETELFVIGGGEIYQQTISKADGLYLTLVDETCSEADVFFPEFRGEDWTEESRKVLLPSGAIQITLRAKAFGQ